MPYFSLPERNLNPKAACLKRREEEKVEDLANRSGGGAQPPQTDPLGKINKICNYNSSEYLITFDLLALN